MANRFIGLVYGKADHCLHHVVVPTTDESLDRQVLAPGEVMMKVPVTLVAHARSQEEITALVGLRTVATPPPFTQPVPVAPEPTAGQ